MPVISDIYIFLLLVFIVTTPLWYTAVQFIKGIKNVSENLIPKELKIITELFYLAGSHPDVYFHSSTYRSNHRNNNRDVLCASQISAFFNCLRFISFLYFDFDSFSLRISKRRMPACWWKLLSSQHCCCLWKSSSWNENITALIINDDLQKYLVEYENLRHKFVVWLQKVMPASFIDKSYRWNGESGIISYATKRGFPVCASCESK